MDIQQPTQQVQTQTPLPPTPIGQKRDKTPVIIVALFLVAIVITGLVYFLLPQKGQKQQTTNNTTTSSTSPQTKDQTPWTTYTDKQYGYWFHHPDTWKLAIDKVNPEKFVLTDDASNQPGEIRGEFFSKEQFSKQGDFTCKAEKKNDAQERPCYTFEQAASSSAYLHVTIENNKPTKAQAFITRPDGKGFVFEITKPNDDSYNVLSIIMATLQFSNEKRSKPLSICPDSWSADQKTALYHGVTFAVEDIDTAWIEANCK